MTLSIKIPFGEACGIVEHHRKDAIATACDRDDKSPLQGSVNHTVINKIAFGIVDGNAYITAILVEVEINRVFVYSCHYIIGASTIT